LGWKPVYDPAEIETFQRQYEIDLYRNIYGPSAFIAEETFCMIECTSMGRVTIENIPNRVLDRLVQLTGAATRLAAVQNWNLPRRPAFVGGGL
jgi:hypothetical protein